MLAELDEAVGPDERCCRRGDEHLPAVSNRCDACRSVHVVSDIALVGDERRPSVQADSHVDRAGRQRLRERGCSRESARRGRNAKKKASPWVSTSTPPAAVHASRMTRRCSASASAYATAPRSCRSFVEPSTSVKRNVTVPVGRSSRTRRDHPPARSRRPVMRSRLERALLPGPVCGNVSELRRSPTVYPCGKRRRLAALNALGSRLTRAPGCCARRLSRARVRTFTGSVS